MGLDRNKRAASQSDTFQLQGARIWLPLEAFHGAAYASLSISAKALSQLYTLAGLLIPSVLLVLLVVHSRLLR